MNEIPCPFCSPPPAPHGGMKIAFLATDLCAEHLARSGIPEFERNHPLVGNERPCNDTCGCLSMEESREFLDDPESFMERRRASRSGAGEGE